MYINIILMKTETERQLQLLETVSLVTQIIMEMRVRAAKDAEIDSVNLAIFLAQSFEDETYDTEWLRNETRRSALLKFCLAYFGENKLQYSTQEPVVVVEMAEDSVEVTANIKVRCIIVDHGVIGDPEVGEVEGTGDYMFIDVKDAFKTDVESQYHNSIAEKIYTELVKLGV